MPVNFSRGTTARLCRRKRNQKFHHLECERCGDGEATEIFVFGECGCDGTEEVCRDVQFVAAGIGAVGVCELCQDSEQHGFWCATTPTSHLFGKHSHGLEGLAGNVRYHFPKPFKLEKRLIDMVEEDVDGKYYLTEERLQGLFKSCKKEKEKGNGFDFKPRGGVGDIAVTIQSRPGNRKTDNFLYEEIDTI